MRTGGCLLSLPLLGACLLMGRVPAVGGPAGASARGVHAHAASSQLATLRRGHSAGSVIQRLPSVAACSPQAQSKHRMGMVGRCGTPWHPVDVSTSLCGCSCMRAERTWHNTDSPQPQLSAHPLPLLSYPVTGRPACPRPPRSGVLPLLRRKVRKIVSFINMGKAYKTLEVGGWTGVTGQGSDKQGGQWGQGQGQSRGAVRSGRVCGAPKPCWEFYSRPPHPLSGAVPCVASQVFWAGHAPLSP